MKKTKKLLCLVSALALVMTAGCGGEKTETKEPETSTPVAESKAPEQKPSAGAVKLSVGTGAVGGSVYTTGSGWANVINNALAGSYELTAEQTGGTVANVSLLETGEVNLGITATDILYGAYTGTASWANGTKFVKPLAVFTCDMPSLCPFSLKGSNIKTLHDLDGKRVGLGPKGSSIDSVFGVVFEEMGITPAMIHNDTWSATITALKDGVIDAVVTQSAVPWPSLTELEATNDVEMLQMTDEELAVIKELYPYYNDSTIAAGSYKANADFDIKTLCQWTVMAASADLDEQVVYDLCEATFNNYDDLALVNNALKLAVPENAEKVPVEWHPGAQRWYTEHNVKLQTPLEGFAPQG